MLSVGKVVEGIFDLGQGRLWRERFLAWWEGVELEPELDYITADFAPSENGSESGADGDSTAVDKATEKIAAVQQIWGKGFEAPGGHEFVLELVHPINLSRNQEVLQLGAALGGTSRALAETFLVSVTALVKSVDVAHIAMEQTVEAGLEQKVRFAPFIPEKMGLRTEKYQCVLAREVLFTLQDKSGLIDQIQEALSPGGHLLIYDFVLPDSEETSEEVKAWSEEEADKPCLVSAKHIIDTLQKKNFAVLTNEEVTEEYYGLIIEGWTNALRTVKKMKILGDLNDNFILHLLDEAERWSRRATLLKASQLRYVRIHAMKSLAS